MNARAKPFELRGWHVLFLLLSFFGAIMAVNIVFAVAAVRTFPGEAVPRSYVQGLQYNDTLAERRAQSALGWRATAALAPAASGAALSVTLTARDGTPVGDAVLSGELEWPTDARYDREVVFVQSGAGVYTADLSDLRPGRWRLRARAERAGGEALDFESELTWRPRR